MLTGRTPQLNTLNEATSDPGLLQLLMYCTTIITSHMANTKQKCKRKQKS